MANASLPFLSFSEELPEVVRRELDQYTAKLRRYLLVSLNEDGTLRTANNDDNPSATIINNTSGPGTGIDEEQWWKRGPWTLDDPNATLPNVVALRPPSPPAGTYHNYAPPGIENAVALEVNPSGAITLTGILKATNTRKRVMMLRNSSTTNTITLKHASTSSLLGNRFALPAATDVLLDPGQNIWLYYDLAQAAWSAAITTQKAGGFNVGGAGGGDVVGPAGATADDIATYNGATGKIIKDSGYTTTSLLAAAAAGTVQQGAVVTWNNADIVAGTAQQLVAAVANFIIVPVAMEIHSDFTSPVGGYNTSRAMQCRYASGATTIALLDESNTAFHNTAVARYERMGPPANANFTTNNPVNVAVNGQPSGTNTFLGVPPSLYTLSARLLYVLVPGW